MSGVPPVPAQFSGREEAFVAGYLDARDGEPYVNDGPYVDPAQNAAYQGGWELAVQDMIGAEG